jgi:hypothetical protein
MNTTKTLSSRAAFAWGRRAPLAVLLVNVNWNLVRVGGAALSDLREDVYDNARNSAVYAEIDSVYDIALSGGEPYAIWN